MGGGLQCTAKSKRSGQRCKRPPTAGYRVCRSHGANPSNRGGGPAGNKHALATGEHEAIWLDQLEPDERHLVARIDTDALVQLAEELRLATLRERRMLQRIALLAPHEYTVVERSVQEETSTDFLLPKAARGQEDEPTPIPVEKTKTVRSERYEGTLGQIQRIEEALTRVQERKAKLIELAHRLSASADDGSLDELTRALAESRRLAATRTAPATS